MICMKIRTEEEWFHLFDFTIRQIWPSTLDNPMAGTDFQSITEPDGRLALCVCSTVLL